MVCRPKELGGLGIHDLSCFGRALRQRWCWYHWTDDERPWKGMTLSCNEEDKALFRPSMMICLGNGRNAIFWHDKWLNGSVPIDIAPNLYKLACFKSRTVAKELRNKNWMGVARHITSREQLVEFIKLWSLIKNVNLREEENDHIQWKWTRVYSAASAYHL
jgi:hypothetical protein